MPGCRYNIVFWVCGACGKDADIFDNFSPFGLIDRKKNKLKKKTVNNFVVKTDI